MTCTSGTETGFGTGTPTRASFHVSRKKALDWNAVPVPVLAPPSPSRTEQLFVIKANQPPSCTILRWKVANAPGLKDSSPSSIPFPFGLVPYVLLLPILVSPCSTRAVGERGNMYTRQATGFRHRASRLGRELAMQAQISCPAPAGHDATLEEKNGRTRLSIS